MVQQCISIQNRTIENIFRCKEDKEERIHYRKESKPISITLSHCLSEPREIQREAELTFAELLLGLMIQSLLPNSVD